MGSSPSIEYHGAALEMLGASPARSPWRERMLADRERDCGVVFPKAVAEWFALEDGHRLFDDHSDHGRLEEVEQLGDPSETPQGYLRVAGDNQGAVAFYVRLDQGEDPPVYANSDGETRTRISLRFSNFVFDMVSVGRLQAARRGLYLRATGPAPEPDHLQALGRQLRPGPVTRSAELEVHRFFGRHEYATVRWEPRGEAEWHLEADSPEALEALRATVDGVMTVPAPAPRRRSVLARLRRP